MRARKSERLGFVGHEVTQRPGQPDGLGGQSPPDQVGPGTGRVSLVEEEIEDGKDRPGPVHELVIRWHPKRDPGMADLAPGPNQPLGHRRFGHQKGTAISPVVRPASVRSVRATWESSDRAG